MGNFTLLHKTIVAYICREREAYARNCVYLSKIENNSYHQKIVILPMPVLVVEF